MVFQHFAFHRVIVRHTCFAVDTRVSRSTFASIAFPCICTCPVIHAWVALAFVNIVQSIFVRRRKFYFSTQDMSQLAIIVCLNDKTQVQEILFKRWRWTVYYIYTRTYFIFKLGDDICTKLESAWAELYLSYVKPILFAVCYRPPKHMDLLNTYELCYLDCICFTNKYIIMMGSFIVDYSQMHYHTYQLHVSIITLISCMYHVYVRYYPTY